MTTKKTEILARPPVTNSAGGSMGQEVKSLTNPPEQKKLR
jgi:hypothetical protein